jgi:hypothetical protein
MDVDDIAGRSDSVFEVDASAFVAHIHPEGEGVVVPSA